MSSSSSEAKWPFDVFLSFRGPDVRHGFLAHLHRALLHRGINAYIDSEDLGPGDEISPALKKAIEESRIAVLVFSENYASSGWCLEELVKVMECKRLKGQLVLPVFYRVEPSEIRGQRESYGKALARHEEKLGKDSEKVKKWRQALIEAANLSGWQYSDGDETKFIENIVKEISPIVGCVPLSVAKNPVGVDCRVEEVKSLLSMGSDDVRMIGIWGTGGFGKTTMAKAVYNSIASQFGGYSFLPNVRETSSKSDGLVHLQKTLLSEILGKENLVDFSVDGGAILIRDRLCCKKILLVLDDVDHGNQLNALARECEWFGKGSRIIITTRDKHLLTSHGIDQVHEVKPLDRGEAFELLNSYAFPRNQTKDISRDLIDNILGYANGLPLAIVVLGSFLCGRSREEWESTLGRLAESPMKDINSVLKISFDALEDNEKDIFLDIACFFKGRDRDYVTRVLDSCGLKTLIGIQILIERSLVTIENERRVQMHDLIQLMGQDIVKQECPDDPGKRSRLWCYDDVFEVLSEDTGTNAVKGIVLQLQSQEELDISPSAFTHMGRLKLLIVQNAQISGVTVCLPKDLRWIEWPGCPLSTLKFSACPKKLVCFDVPNSQIKEFGGNLKNFHRQTSCQVILPGGETPKWLLPNKEGYISFVASKDLYKKILGVAFCVVFRVEGESLFPFELMGSVNCKGTKHTRYVCPIESDHVWLQYMESKELWTVDHFGPNDSSHFHFSIRVSSAQEYGPYDRVFVKKCGLRLICKPLENDLEVQDDQLLDPALFYEVSHEDNPTSTEEESSGETRIGEEGLNMVDFSIEKHRYSSLWHGYRNVHPGREMPKEFVLVEDNTISFMASRDLYNKFLGLLLCVVFGVEDGKQEISFDIVPHVNGQRRNELSGTLGSFDSDHVWIQRIAPNVLWGVLEGHVDFGQFGERYLRFSLELKVSGGTMKRLGYVMTCYRLEDDLKLELDHERLMDPASLCQDTEELRNLLGRRE